MISLYEVQTNRFILTNRGIHFHCDKKFNKYSAGFVSRSFSVPIAANKKELVYKTKVNPIHTIINYGDYHDFMDR